MNFYFLSKIHHLDYRYLLGGNTNSCPKDGSTGGLNLTTYRLGLRPESRVLSELSPNTQLQIYHMDIYIKKILFLFYFKKNIVVFRRGLGMRLRLLGAAIIEYL